MYVLHILLAPLQSIAIYYSPVITGMECAFGLSLIIEGVWSFLEKWTYAFQSLASIATVIGIACGAIWWFKARDNKPKAQIKVTLETVSYGDDTCLFRTTIRIKNIGRVILQTHHITFYVYQLKPLPQNEGEMPPDNSNVVSIDKLELENNKREYKWPCLLGEEKFESNNIFEPGESDSIVYERLVKVGDIYKLPTVVSVYVHVPNIASGTQIGWSVNKLFRVKYE